jgi:hypothetical protein
MKNNLVKYIAAFYFCSIFAMFAQTPGTENGQPTGDGSLEDTGVTDTTPMPIDDYAGILALAGLIFVYTKFRAIKKVNS